MFTTAQNWTDARVGTQLDTTRGCDIRKHCGKVIFVLVYTRYEKEFNEGREIQRNGLYLGT